MSFLQHTLRTLSLKHTGKRLFHTALAGAALALAGCMESAPSAPDASPAQTQLSNAAAVGTKPVITLQPLSVTVNVSDKYTFKVTATGTAPLAYQWQEYGVNIPGATSASYTAVAHMQDSGSAFTCNVTNALGTAVSDAARPKILTLDYQAENAALQGAVVAAAWPDYTGTGYADYQNPSNDNVLWTVKVTNAGSYRVEFIYANGGAASRPLKIQVNGVTTSASFAFPSTVAWSTWGSVSFTTNLKAGTNTVRATAIGSSGANIDKLKIN